MDRRELLKILGIIGASCLVPAVALGKAVSNTLETQVWKSAYQKLSKFTSTRYQFRYVEPQKSLPKVFIYGDSISIGYTEYVRQSLAGEADVFRLHVNGGASGEFINKMEAFRKGMFKPNLPGGWDFEWDIIHFNVGLHDLKYLHDRKLDKVNGVQFASLETYAKNLERVVAYLKSTYPNTKLVFATTTPVPEGEPGRIAGDAKRYNKVALKVIKKYKDISINDLYKFSRSVMEQYAQGAGNVHYLPEGSRLQGIEVANVIAQELGLETVECPLASTIVEDIEAYGGSIGKQQKVIIH